MLHFLTIQSNLIILLQSITSLNEIANRAQSKECVIQFTKLFIDNIIYERKIIDKSNFVDTNFKGVQLKKLKESSQDRLIKNLDVYFEGIKDAIEKEYVITFIFNLTQLTYLFLF